MIGISKHISYKEATKSNTAIKNGIDNNPDSLELKNMRYIAEEIFEPMRKHFGKPIIISSFFRSEKLNIIIGGSSTSQHCSGEAMDLDGDNTDVDNKDIFDYIKDNIIFDQLIWEYGNNDKPNWVHVSRKTEGNRRQVLQVTRDVNGKSKYREFDLY